jgi:hypothetical protein
MMIPSPESQPTIILMFFTFRGGDAATSLAPFRDGAAKPIVDQVKVWTDMLAVSHCEDEYILAGSRRMAIRGALITDFWPDLVLDVWNRWCKFTEDEDATKMDKVASVGPTDLP